MDVDKVASKLGTDKQWLKEFLAEFTGTFIFVFVGNCSVAQWKMTGDGSLHKVNIAYAFAVAIGVIIAFSSSGAHLNPAVSLAMAVIGRLPWKSLLHYFLAQYLGAFLSAPCTYLVYMDAFSHFDQNHHHVLGLQGTAGIFCTYPAPYVSLGNAVVDQIAGTFVLLIAICAVVDKINESPPWLVSIFVGLIILVIGMAMGSNVGYPINPARDLGPRIYITIAGWGSEAFTYRDYWWIPILATHIGAILGALVYIFCIEIHNKGSADSS